MRILCITSVYPPCDSESFCTGKMVLALEQEGADIHVLYMDDPEWRGRADASPVWSALPSSTAIPHHPNADRTRATILAAKYQTVAWPRWISDVVESARQLHRESPFDVVYSRIPPMAGHIAGYWIARNLDLPWIANFNDPWDYHLFPGRERVHASFRSRLSEHWLKRTLKNADVVTFPCARLAEYTLRQAKYRRQYEVVPHIGYALKSNETANEFRLVHAGKMGSNEITGRSTAALLQGLKQFTEKQPEAKASTRLVLVGKEDPQTTRIAENLSIGEIITTIGQVTYEQSLAHIGAASACVLIEGKMDEGVYFPSKLADYLTAQKPIIALSPAEGTVADMTSGGGIVRVDQDDAQAIENAIGLLYQAFRRGQLSELAPTANSVRQLDPAVVAQQFLRIAGSNRPRARGEWTPSSRAVETLKRRFTHEA